MSFLRSTACAIVLAGIAIPGVAQTPDPRTGLKAGWLDAEQAAWNLRLVTAHPRPQGFFNPANPGDFFTANTDLAFQGNLVFVGSFAGFQIFDVSDPANPRLRSSQICPGGQGDLSVYNNLLFMSVEMPNGRTDCGTGGALGGPPSPDRLQGIRIFDISNLDQPRQVAAIQTCRGSHTHTLVTDSRDRSRVFIYVSGVFPARSPEELPGCFGGSPEENPNTAHFRIEVIEVPLAAPETARIVNTPRIFADRATGAIAGLWAGGDHGPGTQRTAVTDQCHDITVYPEVGLAAGACSGNGILLDISDPANPVRIDEVLDRNFAYWHSATFSNDGRSVIFTDEWGGGTQPRCRATDSREWGANAIFRLADRKLQFASYYKLPAPQGATENCVAHNGSLVPVPGRDIKVQAWYQGGISVFDFTDPARPFEIAYFDRGPVSDSALALGGQWSTYWYNGRIYGAEIARGLDVLELVPSPQLSQNEIDAAKLVYLDRFNPQTQPRLRWPAAFVVARAYLDQLARGTAVPANRLATLRADLDRAETMPHGAARRTALQRVATTATQLAGNGTTADAGRLRALTATVRELGEMPLAWGRWGMPSACPYDAAHEPLRIPPPPMPHSLLADLTLLVHLLFVVFVLFGGFLALRWTWMPWLHLPAAAWGAYTEFAGVVCPLTPLENHFRRLGGQAGYQGGFIEHYVTGTLYPEGLTRDVQMVLGLVAVTVNLAIYAVVVRRRRRRRAASAGG